MLFRSGGHETARKDLANVSAATNAVAGKMTAAQVVELLAATAAIIVNANGIAQEIIDRVADVDAEESRAVAAEGVLNAQQILNIAQIAANLASIQAHTIDIAANVADILLKGDIDGQTFTNVILTGPTLNLGVAGSAIDATVVGTDDFKLPSSKAVQTYVDGFQISASYFDVLSSRSVSTTYTNSTGAPMIVYVTTNTLATQLRITKFGTPLLSHIAPSGGTQLSFMFYVAPNDQYQVVLNGPGASMISWYEQR